MEDLDITSNLRVGHFICNQPMSPTFHISPLSPVSQVEEKHGGYMGTSVHGHITCVQHRDQTKEEEKAS